MTSSKITIMSYDNQSFSGYLASPKSGRGPGIIVIQEIFGINEGMRQLCNEWANLGYFALCPDLFWRQEPGIELDDKSEENWKRAFELFEGFDVDNGIKDIISSINFIRQLFGFNRKVGCVGYCLGGLLSYLTACRSDIDAAVGYYGVSIDERLDEARNIKAPTLLHIAGNDEFVSKEAQKAMHKGLDNHPHVTLYDYPGQNHAFARPNGTHYDEKAATLANKRTREFFENHLK